MRQFAYISIGGEGNRMGRMQDKIVVLTGAASGIGEATARLMVQEGAHVLLADVSDERGEKLAEELGTQAVFHHCDVLVEADIAAVVASAVHRHGRLDCILNNAAVMSASGPIDELTGEEFDSGVAVLLRSVFFGMKHAAAVMKSQRHGVILSTASVAGLRGGLGPHVYATAKAGIVGLTRNVAAELAPYSVRAVAVAPGKVITPMSTPHADDLEEAAREFAARTPLRGRAGLAADVAYAVVWLASDEAGFVSGTTIVVDGGLSTGSVENMSPEALGSWVR